MAIHDKNPPTELKTAVIPAEIVAAPIDREKMKRHDDCHNADMKLASELQAQWAKRVNIEHRLN